MYLLLLQVLVHWACVKVRTSEDDISDETLKNLIHDKLASNNNNNNISYTEVAMTADR